MLGLFILIFLILLLVLIAAGKKSRRSQKLLTTDQKILIESESSPIASIATIATNAARMSWGHKLDLIAYDRLGDDKFYDVWTMKPDGSDQKCLTCDHPNLPNKNMGNPDWHPSGDYILFQAERADNPGDSRAARPGAGVHNNLWVIAPDGKQAWQLTDLTERATGVLHPHFSYDGTNVVWAQMSAFPTKEEGVVGGQWSLKVADFVVSGDTPSLSNIQTFEPNGKVLYETHGFSPDGSKIIFTAKTPGQPSWAMDIYTLDLKSQKLTNLTSSNNHWDEMGTYSPSGQKIVWLSTNGIISDNWNGDLGKFRSEVFMMNGDGSEKMRLTFFNDSDSPEFLSTNTHTGDMSWNLDGTKLLVRVNPKGEIIQKSGGERIMLIEFKEAQ